MRRLIGPALIVAGLVVLGAGQCASGPGQQASSAPTSTVALVPDAAPGDEPAAGPPSTPPATSTSTTSTTAPGMADTDRLERDVPLTQWLPHDTPTWSITYTRTGPATIALTIMVKAILNNERDLPTYKARLATGHNEAVAYLVAHGGNPAAFAITWVPLEAGR